MYPRLERGRRPITYRANDSVETKSHNYVSRLHEEIDSGYRLSERVARFWQKEDRAVGDCEYN